MANHEIVFKHACKAGDKHAHTEMQGTFPVQLAGWRTQNPKDRAASEHGGDSLDGWEIGMRFHSAEGEA